MLKAGISSSIIKLFNFVHIITCTTITISKVADYKYSSKNRENICSVL